jgi:hypothetical protein
MFQKKVKPYKTLFFFAVEHLWLLLSRHFMSIFVVFPVCYYLLH